MPRHASRYRECPICRTSLPGVSLTSHLTRPHFTCVQCGNNFGSRAWQSHQDETGHRERRLYETNRPSPGGASGGTSDSASGSASGSTHGRNEQTTTAADAQTAARPLQRCPFGCRMTLSPQMLPTHERRPHFRCSCGEVFTFHYTGVHRRAGHEVAAVDPPSVLQAAAEPVLDDAVLAAASAAAAAGAADEEEATAELAALCRPMRDEGAASSGSASSSASAVASSPANGETTEAVETPGTSEESEAPQAPEGNATRPNVTRSPTPPGMTRLFVLEDRKKNTFAYVNPELSGRVPGVTDNSIRLPDHITKCQIFVHRPPEDATESEMVMAGLEMYMRGMRLRNSSERT